MNPAQPAGGSGASPVVIDARAIIDGRPVALMPVLGKPWLKVYLDAARDAGALGRVTVVAPAALQRELAEAVAGLAPGSGVKVTPEAPGDSGAITLDITRVYLRHRLVKALRRGDERVSRLSIFEITKSADVAAAGAFVYRDMWLPLARPFNMPAARGLAIWLRGTSVTPNQVTLAGLAMRLGAAVAAGFGTWPLGIGAAVLIETAWTLDLADGYLARLTGRTSKLGRWLDTFVDEAGSVTILAALTVGAMRATGDALWLYVGLAAMAANHLTAFGFWYGGNEGGGDQPANSAGQLPRRPRGLVQRVGSGFFGVYRSIDARPHILALGLLANVPQALVGFFALAGTLSLLRYVQIQFAKREDQLD